MKNWLLFLVLSFVLTGAACSKTSETESAITLPPVSVPENQEKKQGWFEETGQKMDQGIQKAGNKIEQGLDKAGQEIEKGLNKAGEEVEEATN